MRFDLDRLSAADRYELLLNAVVPRPIAVVTTLAAGGGVNAAPYSLFNLVNHDPPLMAVSVLPHPEGRLKDTARNILDTRQFVVNLVSEALAEAMNLTCIDAPPEVDELALAALQPAASERVAPPRIAQSPAAFECELVTALSFGAHQALVIGRILCAHIADACVLDAARCLIDTPRLNLIGGMHAARWYTRTADLFAMDRPTWATWQKR